MNPRLLLLSALIALVACSTENPAVPDAGTTAGAAGTSGSAGQAAAGSSSGNAAVASAGAGTGGGATTSDGGTAAVVQGGNAGSSSTIGGAGASGSATAGSAAAGAGTGGNPSESPCSQVMGLTLTREWYDADFEKDVRGERWQLQAAQSAYVEEWAKPDSPFWQTPLVSPCTAESAAPGRVVFVVLSWELMKQQDWETAISGAVANIRAKLPSVKRIDLTTIIRGPNNAACGDPNVYKENTHIPEPLDAALQQIAAKTRDLVKVAPPFAVDSCADFKDVGPHLTAAGNQKLAMKIAAYVQP